MLRVVINADDLGASSLVNEAIEACIQKGEITSSTIIAGGPAFNEVARIVKTYSEISFGVHLTLDEYESITRSPILFQYGLTDNNSVFVKDGYKRVVHYTEELKKAIYDEWQAQIMKVKELGIDISHADSHHHCHTYKKLRGILLDVLRENGITKVRLPQTRSFNMRINGIRRPSIHNNEQEDCNLTHNSLFLLRAVVGSFRDLILLLWYKKRFKTVDFFSSASFMQIHKTYLLNHYSKWEVELMCHPGHPNYENETRGLKEMCNGCIKINYFQI